MCFQDETLKIIFIGTYVEKTEIRLKSENLHPCLKVP